MSAPSLTPHQGEEPLVHPVVQPGLEVVAEADQSECGVVGNQGQGPEHLPGGRLLAKLTSNIVTTINSFFS